MPGFLKFLTVMALACIIFIISTLLPGSVNIHGQIVSTRQWWSNGSGYVLAISLMPLCSSGILMLRRVAHSRFLHIFGWVFSGIGAFVTMKINDVMLSQRVEYAYAGFSIASTIVFAAYLYFNKDVRSYFEGQIQR
jgi:hypothetical protein